MTPVDWLNQLYGNAPGGGYLTLFCIDPATGVQYVRFDESIVEIAKKADYYAQRCHVWYGIATRKKFLDKGRGGKEDCLAIPGLWLDIDVAGPNHKTAATLPPTIDAAFELLSDFPVPPTAVVHTGGGLQPYWLFDEMRLVEECGDLLDDWHHTWSELANRRGYHLDNVSNVDRVLRLPGTFNRKNGGAVAVEVMEAA